MRFVALAAGLLFPPSLSAQPAAPPVRKSISLFPVDRSCVCVRTRTWTATLDSRQRTAGHEILQVFLSRATGREVFRIHVGSIIDGMPLMLWNFGIAREGDWNGDGAPDYSWYGGDDTSEALYLLLSSPEGYRKVNILESFEAHWRRRFRGPVPDLALFGRDWHVTDVELLLLEGGGLALAAKAETWHPPGTPPRRLRIASPDFPFTTTPAK